MKKNKIQRQPKGGQYYFIGKKCVTNDWHFFSDNEKWEGGNYFLSREAVEDCLARINEKHGEAIEKIDYRNEQNSKSFIRRVCKLLDSVPKGKRGENPPATDASLIFDLLDAVDVYKTTKDELNACRDEIMLDVKRIIAGAPKT